MCGIAVRLVVVQGGMGCGSEWHGLWFRVAWVMVQGGMGFGVGWDRLLRQDKDNTDVHVLL